VKKKQTKRRKERQKKAPKNGAKNKSLLKMCAQNPSLPLFSSLFSLVFPGGGGGLFLRAGLRSSDRDVLEKK
jgi:hypothetical protein